MITLRNNFVTGSTLLLWVLMSAISTLGCLLIASATIYLNYDCWIMYQDQLTSGSCGPGYSQGFILSIAIVLGLIIGTFFTCKLTKQSCRDSFHR